MKAAVSTSGPHSAGASPGPACYGNGGTRPTVTDAHLLLGHLAADRFLAGRMQLDTAASTRVVESHVAAPLGLDVPLAAGGIIAIATAAMANAVRAVTTERGLDPRDFVLFAYGGAGPLHAVDVARELAIRTVVIPQAPGTFSAFGMLTADLRREYAQTHRAPLTDEGLRSTEAMFGALQAEATTWLQSAGVPSENTFLEYGIDVRYVGQNYSVTIPLKPGSAQADVKRAFDAAHQQRYSHSAPEEAAEIIAARVSIIGQLSKPVLTELSAGSGTPAPAAVLGKRRVRFDPRTEVDATVYNRHAFLAGDTFAGPAIVQEDGSATVIPGKRYRAHSSHRSHDSHGGRMTTAANVEHDPITAEIIRNALIAITDEMKTNLMRTAYNPIIYEALDYTVGLFDKNGDTVSIGLGLPMFIRGLSDAIKAKLEFYGPDGIEPGDILLTNDAYIMGSHLNHLIFTVPIFWEGKIVAFSSSMAHWIDIGGTLGSRTQDIYSEGLQIPIVKVYKRGVQDDEITRIIRTNVRVPELAMGDFRAQIAAIRTGEQRYGALLKKYGLAAVDASIVGVATLTERAAASIGRGDSGRHYEAESYMDDDGITDKQIPIKVKVIVKGDEMTIDLTDVSPQVQGYSTPARRPADRPRKWRSSA